MADQASPPGKHVRRLTTSDLPAAHAILEETLGAGYIDAEELGGYASHPGKTAFVAEAGSRITAVATGLAVPSNSLLDAMPADQRSPLLGLVPELGGSIRTGLLKSVAVDPSVRRAGIGRAVSGAVSKELADGGSGIIVSIGWTDADGCHIQGTLESLGFRSRGDLPDFWRADSLLRSYSCPTCGHPCRCAARVFCR